MKYNEFLNKIKIDDMEPAYLFVGKEEYLMNTSIETLKIKYVKGPFEEINFNRIQGKDGDLETLINACETLPFMSEKKIVIVRDVTEFLDNIDKSVYDDMYTYLDDLGDFLCLIFVDDTGSLRKNTKFYRFFNKKQTAVDFSKLVGQDLNAWITNILNQHNKSISFSDMNYFVEKTSYRSRNIDLGLYDLENELLKVINHSKDKKIVRADIDSVLIESIDTNIFQLLDAISRFDSDKAIEVFDDMYMSNEPIQRMFFMITRQIRLLLSYKLYRARGYNQKQTQDKLKIKSYEFGKIASQAERWSVEQLKGIMNELLEIDIKIKTTSSDGYLLIQTLLVRLCSQN